MTREPAPGRSCMARTVASSADVTPTTRRCEYYEYRVTMPRSRPTNTHCSPILKPLSSRPPNNNIISIENKVSSRNFTSCLATLVSLLSSLISHLSSPHLSGVTPGLASVSAGLATLELTVTDPVLSTHTGPAVPR